MVTLDEMATMMAKNSLMFWRPDFSPNQAKSICGMYFEDLQQFAAAVVDEAFKRHRRDPESRFFPTSGQLLAICRRIPDPGYEIQRRKWDER